MGVNTKAIEMFLASDPVTRSPTIVRSWLEAILSSGEGTNSQLVNEEFSHMSSLLNHYTKHEIAATWGLSPGTVWQTVKELGIATIQHGKNKVITKEDLKRVEADLRARGHVPLDER